VSWPAVRNARSTALGVILVLLATASYGVAVNIAEPLQRKYGSLPVLLRAQLIALIMTALPGSFAIPGSSFDWVSLGAMVPLGCLGTGLAFVAMTNLVGRVGAARASIAVYFIPIVAVVLGVLLRDESVHPVSLFGTALVIVGAVLVSRAGRSRR
jgi:drug/metabolite transporter (DMT)-like permease